MAEQTDNSPPWVLCPGQGAQHVGMGEAWFDRYAVAAQTFAAADRVLGFELSTLCFSGPEERLNRTEYAQPAIYVTSVACYQALLEAGRLASPGATAGLSLGEFTALHLAGAFDFAAGLKLVRLRGQAMQEAAEANPGSMVALTGDVTEARVQELCEQVMTGGEAEANGERPVLVPANYNSPMQVVVSGSVGACVRAVEMAEGYGWKATPLQVAGAFHSPLMRSAADRLAAALDEVAWESPTVPVLSNVTARPHDPSNIEGITARLVDQLTSPVRWSQSMQWAVSDDATPGRFVEMAPGKVLSGLMRRIERGIKVESYAEPG